MKRIPGLRRTIDHSATAARVARDVDDEIAWHLDAVTADFVSKGMDPVSARRAAEQQFGDLDAHRQNLRQVDGATARQRRWQTLLFDTVSDVRYAVRGLLREPLFAAGAILTLAIGLAANTTMFSVVDRLLLQPPPHVRDDGRMSLIYFQKPGRNGATFVQSSTSYPDFATLRDSTGVVDQAAAWWVADASLGRGMESRQVRVGLATGNFFETLGTRAVLGRTLGPADDTDSATETPIVISDALWRGTYGADPTVLGRVIQLSQRQVTVVGVLPPGFHGPSIRRVDAWVPMRPMVNEFLGSDTWETSRQWFWLRVVAHRKADVTAEMAATRATAVHQTANRAAKEDSTSRVVFGPIEIARGAGLRSGTGQSGLSAQAQVATWLAGVAGVVLLIVCANLANLLLSRAARRRREIAVRLALGVRQGRLVRQFLSETTILCLAAAGLAMLLSVGGAGLMRRTLLEDLAWEGPTLTGRLILFTLVGGLATVLIAGWIPAWLASRQDLTGALKASARGGGQRRTPLQRVLLVTQAALSVLLLCGAGLFVRSLRNVSTMPLGYDAQQVLVASVDLGGVAEKGEAQLQFWREALETARNVPGVASASLGVTAPFASSWGTDFFLPGRDSIPEITDGPYINSVTSEWLTTLGTRVVRGRGFQPTDVKGSEPVALVNDHMARVLWPNGNALGQCIKVGADTAPCTTVVGVTENSVRDNLKEEVSPQYLVLQDQGVFSAPSWRNLFIRTSGDPDLVIASLRERLHGLRANLPWIEIRSIATLMDEGVQPWRLGATMFGLFGLIALLVAAVGLYAVIGYDVTQRWHEFGVRSALGARPGHLVRLIVSDGVRHAGVGLVVGLVAAWMLAPLAKDMLFQVSPRDVATLLTVSGVLLVVSVLACLLPARRAARLEPTEAIRAD